MFRVCLFLFRFLAAVAAFPLLGCNDSGGSISVHQARLVLNDEPDEGLQTVMEVRETLLEMSSEIHKHAHGHEGYVEDVADHYQSEGKSEESDDHAEHEGEAVHLEDHQEHESHSEEDGHDEDDGHDHDGEEHEHHAEEGEGHDHDHAEHEHAENESEEPEDPDHIHPAGPIEVVMVGTVGGLTNPWEEMQPKYPFGRGEAVLFVCDAGAVAEREASGHVHAPGEECAFCAAHAAETSHQIAMVRFVDDNSKVLPLETKDLFDVQPLDTVVIKGAARITEGGMIIVDGYGLYIRK